MIEVQVFIPVADNDGYQFSTAEHGAFEEFVAGLFGGATRYPDSAVGVWFGGGVLYRDELRVYGIAIASIIDGGKFAQVVDFVKSHYRQLAVCIRHPGGVEIL